VPSKKLAGLNLMQPVDLSSSSDVTALAKMRCKVPGPGHELPCAGADGRVPA
jgi:hypothetical protein